MTTAGTGLDMGMVPTATCQPQPCGEQQSPQWTHPHWPGALMRVLRGSGSAQKPPGSRGPRGGTGAESPEEAVRRLFQAQVTSGSDMKMTRAPGHLHPAAQKHLPSDTCCTQRHHTHTGTPHTETHTRHTDTQHTHAHTRTPPGSAEQGQAGQSGSSCPQAPCGCLARAAPSASTSLCAPPATSQGSQSTSQAGWVPRALGAKQKGQGQGQEPGATTGSDLGRRLEEARRCCLGGADARRTEDGAVGRGTL